MNNPIKDLTKRNGCCGQVLFFNDMYGFVSWRKREAAVVKLMQRCNDISVPELNLSYMDTV